MKEKQYSFGMLSKYNKTYNEMIEFLKKTIPEESRPEIMQKFEDRAMEDEDRIAGLKWMFNINGFGTIATTLIAMFGKPGVLGATLAIGPYTIFYYLWCKNVMQQAKFNKEECLKFMQAVSEKQNNIIYPFTVGNDEDLDKLKDYAKLMSKKSGEGIIEYFKNLSLDEENYAK